MSTRTRFAPSPTGYLHTGGIRTALFAWLLARQAKGQFVLRIEDTDKQREVEGSEAHIKECLEWLGLNWDEGPGTIDGFGPYRQSERLQIYKEWASKLLEAGHAYADTTTAQDLEKLRQQAKDKKQPFLFRNHRPVSPPTWDGSLPLRFKSDPKAYKWHDEVMGDLSSGPEAIDDFILIKSDGYPTYNFAHIIDDHLMQISHVIRSQEFLSSVPKFLNLYDALGIKWPLLATMPYVMGPDGKKKLSKRDGAKDILDYRRDGFLPEAIINFMATLGWNDGTEQEIFSVSQLVEKFSLSRVQRSGACFDEQRLVWMNGQYIRQLSIDELYSRIENDNGKWWGEVAVADEHLKKDVLKLVQERLKYLSELESLSYFFFRDPTSKEIEELLSNPPDKKLKDLSYTEIKNILKDAEKVLAQSSFESADIARTLNELLSKNDLKPAVLFPIIRIAVTGASASPEIFGTLSVIGKEKSLLRIGHTLSLLDDKA